MAENTAVANQQESAVVPINKMVDNVINRVNRLVNEGGLILPQDFAHENALRAAIMVIGDTQDMNKNPALKVCTPESVQEALFKMVCAGLDPQKSQNYFIVHGNRLVMRRSYMGSIVVAKRVADVEDVTAAVIYDKDEFGHEIVNGKIVSVTHKQDFVNLDNPIMGAYCVVTFKDGTKVIDLMTIKQIRESWKMAQGDGTKNKLQNQFGPEAAKRTLIQRALKVVINSSSDANLYQKDMSEDNEVEESEHTVVSSNAQASENPKSKVISLPQQAPKQPVHNVAQNTPVEVVESKPIQAKAAPKAYDQKQEPQAPPATTSNVDDPSAW